MTATASLIGLDSLRADLMRVYLDDEGQRVIWTYDVTTARTAVSMAVADQNFDNLAAHDARKPFVLCGPGIVDHYFATEHDLRTIVRWLCCAGHLRCYVRRDIDVAELERRAAAVALTEPAR